MRLLVNDEQSHLDPNCLQRSSQIDNLLGPDRSFIRPFLLVFRRPVFFVSFRKLLLLLLTPRTAPRRATRQAVGRRQQPSFCGVPAVVGSSPGGLSCLNQPRPKHPRHPWPRAPPERYSGMKHPKLPSRPFGCP